MAMAMQITAEGELMIASYLEAADRAMEEAGRSGAERAALERRLLQQIHGAIAAGGDGDVDGVIRVLESLPVASTFAAEEPLAAPEPVSAAAPRPGAPQSVPEVAAPGVLWSLYLYLMMSLLGAVVLLLGGWRTEVMLEIFVQMGAEAPSLLRTLAPPALFAWRFPGPAVALLLLAHAPLSLLIHWLRGRFRPVGILLPAAVVAGWLAYLIALMASNYHALFLLPKAMGSV